MSDLTFKVARIYKFDGEGALKAFADLNINDSLTIRGVRVIEGQKGTFVSMPKQQGKDKKWYDTVRPLTPGVRDEISAVVLEAYKQK